MTQQCLKCSNGNIDDFHEAFTMGLCMSCYMNEKASVLPVRPVTDRARIRIRHTIDILCAVFIALCCVFIATGIIAIGMWRWF